MDLQTVFNGETFASDLALSGASLATDDGLATAIVISLFTDGPLQPDDPIPEGETGRGGWWGDVVVPTSAPQGEPWRTGSRLRLLSREKQTPETARRAADYCREALSWIVRRGIASAVDVTATWADAGRLDLVITVTRPDGTPQRYRHLWSPQ
jgi:phage gp46-like protein